MASPQCGAFRWLFSWFSVHVRCLKAIHSPQKWSNQLPVRCYGDACGLRGGRGPAQVSGHRLRGRKRRGLGLANRGGLILPSKVGILSIYPVVRRELRSYGYSYSLLKWGAKELPRVSQPHTSHEKVDLSWFGDGSIPIDTFLVGWTSIYQLFCGSLGTRVLIHPHLTILEFNHEGDWTHQSMDWW